jgi:transcriptional regulator with XRE-family HTH domain
LPETEVQSRRRNKRRRANLTADQLVADQIKALRHRRNFSQQQLADKLGWTQSIVARIESGARPISVSELLQISWALDVAPVHLLAASFQPQDVPIQGGLRLSPKDARDWIRGDTPIPGGDHRSYYDNISEEEWAERQKFWASLKGLQLKSRQELVESLAQQREADEKILETGLLPAPHDPKYALEPPVPAVLSEEGKRRKGQLEAAKRTKRRRDHG